MGVNRGFYEVADAGEITDPMPDACIALQRETRNGRVAGMLYTFKQSLTWAPYGSGPGHDFYVDPVSGKDTTYTGTTPDDPFLTVGKAHTTAVDGRGDTAILLNYAGTTDLVENVVITKSLFGIDAGFLMGNARLPTIIPATGIALNVQASAWGFRSNGVRYVGAGASGYGAKLAAEGHRFAGCDFTSGSSHGVFFPGTNTARQDGSGSAFYECLYRECGGSGIRIGDGTLRSFYPTNVKVFGGQFYLNTGLDIDDDGLDTAGSGHCGQWELRDISFMTRNKTVYINIAGGNSAELFLRRLYFAQDSGRLLNTQVVLPAGAVCADIHDATGIVDTSGF